MLNSKQMALGLALYLVCVNLLAAPFKSIDPAGLSTSGGEVQRIFGSVGDGGFGVPVAGRHDMDGDGFNDYVFAAMQASPSGRDSAGQVFLILGNGEIKGDIDTATSNARVFSFLGAAAQENTGSEIWMADVTGDGLGDLLICRQNLNYMGRVGAGALSIIPGQDDFLACSNNDRSFDLLNPPACLNVTTIVGAQSGDRFCMWARTGHVAGDQTDDIVIGADRETLNTDADSGAIYVVRGGAHLDINGGALVDLANFGSTALPGNIARVRPVPTP
ncbi:MAG: hypothetical protein KAG66_08590, partial [Methylococcales bacterium]|nr:hypothetical protein [Methylococcales bacterium]